MLRRRLSAIALALVCSAHVAAAQTVPFGKNKIQYRDFQWHVLSGEHVDVYYYPEAHSIAQLALAYAEESFRVLERRFRHHPFERVPLIVYASHQHFEQTNVLPGMLPEGVLGFTEYLKRRVALPFRGDYAQFRHTLRHELVHFFQISKIAEVRALHPGRERFTPQQVHWWTEGLAEYWSSEQDGEDEMFNRDLVLRGGVPDLRSMTRQQTFASYPLGAELHAYLAGRFGEDYIVRVYEEFWKYGSFEETLEAVVGVELDRLSREWKATLQRRYFPVYGERSPPHVAGVPVVYGAGGNINPALYVDPADSAAHLFFLSGRSGYTSLYRAILEKGEPTVSRVLEGEKTAEFESFNATESRIDIHDSGVVAFVSKYLQRDALVLWDIESERTVGRYQWPDLVGIRSPSWHPGGRRIVFEGLSTAGYSDLYILDFDTQQRTRLTDDRYRDQDPDWGPDGREIVFASDRTPYGVEGASNLYLLDAVSGEIRPLTRGPWVDRAPRWSHSGDRIAFTSDREGTPDLYTIDTEGYGRRITSLIGGALASEWYPGDDGLVFSAFTDGTYRIYRLALSEDTLFAPRIEPEGGPVPGDDAGWDWVDLDAPTLERAEARPYDTWRKVSFDVAGGDAMIAPGIGAAQGVQVLASDMLGDHLLFGGVSAIQAESVQDLIDTFSGSLIYLNRSRRLNFGAGVFRFQGRFRDVFRDLFQEETYGGYFVASYPFSRYKRLEVHFGIERSDRLDLGGFDAGGGPGDLDAERDLTRSGLLASNYLSYAKDNTLWVETGPIDGERYNLSVGFSSCFSCRAPIGATGERVDRDATLERYTLSADYRRYHRLATRSAYALRVYGFFSNGTIPGRAILGGSHRLRGYPRRSLGGSRVALVNQEWRFSVADDLSMRLPIGRFRIPGVEGALFLDAGSSWLEDTDPVGIWGSYGAGLRAAIAPPLVLRLDLGRRYRIGSPPPVYLDSGAMFGDTFLDFFFGYNY